MVLIKSFTPISSRPVNTLIVLIMSLDGITFLNGFVLFCLDFSSSFSVILGVFSFSMP